MYSITKCVMIHPTQENVEVMIMKKKLFCLGLAAVMLVGEAVSVSADLESDLQEEAAWTQSQLDATYNYIDQLYYQKSQLEYQESVISESLYNVMVSIQVLENDIASKEAEITKTEEDLDKAAKAKDKQYESMKQRIQYIYEKGGDDAWFQLLLNAENVADQLTRSEYTQAMYESDRKALEKFANTIEEVQNLEARYEQEKVDMEALKEEYQVTSDELEYQLAVTRDNQADCEDEISYAYDMATEYANTLVEITATLDRLEEERIAAAEAAAAAAAEEAYTDIPEEFINEDGSVDEDYLAEVAESLTVYDEEGNAVSAVEAAETGSVYYDSDGDVVDASEVMSSVASSYGSGSGNAIVDFATQFVGNPYVWGGTSLTSGADCSGFVQSVYANFGISLPRTSYEQETAGYEVSYADAQPGDLICYGSHVAIYLGDGKIVHASNSTDGIKISEDATYRTITSVRRLV